ncbi:MAG: AAA family ATPase [Chloroflexi bacterium]|nr:AAA family ATPase [Chloroflexota bacterium]
MSTLVFIHGPNGVGKSTVCRMLHGRLAHSAWLESEWCRMTNPFSWNEALIALTIHNMAYLLRGYLSCEWVEVVLFPYGFHGPRQRIWDTVFARLADIPFTYVPITLTCAEGEHVARMARDGRSAARIERALAARGLYEALPHPRIDTTHLSADEVADRVIAIVQSAAPPGRGR